jgi:hypothetical protein
MDKIETEVADVNQAAYDDFLVVLNQIFFEASRLAEGERPPEAPARAEPNE